MPEPWEQRAQQPLHNVERFIKKQAFPQNYPQYQGAPQQPPVQPFNQYMSQPAPPPAPTPHNVPTQAQPDQVSTHTTGGTVALIWRDAATDPNTIAKEANRFPTKSITYIADFRDFNTEEEKIYYIKEFEQLIAQYDQVHNRTGGYVIMVGNIIAGLGVVTVNGKHLTETVLY